jgi:glycosyltransferase involved in cell wall biosynthesis
MLGRAVLGATLARRPVVAKLVADEAYERARRWGLFDGDLDAFQRFGGGLRVQLLRKARDRALRRASHLICPSGYLAALAVDWGVPRERVTVLPNAAPPLPSLPDRDEARAALGVHGPMLAFAGRVTRQKSLGVALDALAQVEDVSLLIAGDGPDLAEVRRRVVELGLDGRVRFLGSLGRNDVLTLFRAADASLLTSSWENFPHTVVEALAVGTPVIATRVGGVPELVRDHENGLLVAAGDTEALADAISRLVRDAGLRDRLASEATRTVEPLQSEVLYARLEAILAEAAR